MSKVLTKTRGLANTANNILFIYYFIELFFILILVRKHFMCYIHQYLHSKYKPTWATWSGERYSCPWQRGWTT